MSEFEKGTPRSQPDMSRIESLGKLNIRDFGTAYPGFKLGKKIGQGYFNAVYRLRRGGTLLNSDTGRNPDTLAIKIFLDDVGVQPELALREIKIHSQLTDGPRAIPHVLPIVDFVKVKNPITGKETFGYIQEFMEGGNMYNLDMLADSESERLNLVASTIIDVCEGLQGIHDAGVAHGDIKPTNILFNKRLSTAYIADFGLSHLMRGEEIRDQLESLDETYNTDLAHVSRKMFTEDRGAQSDRVREYANLTAPLVAELEKVEGGVWYNQGKTDEYFPPERSVNRFVPGATVDMYALGAMLYEFRTKRTPFMYYKENLYFGVKEGLEYFVNNDPISVVGLLQYFQKDSTPHYLDAIAQRLVANDPKDRLSLDVEITSADGVRKERVTLPLAQPMDVARAIEVLSKQAGVDLRAERLRFLRKKMDQKI
jgi:serine/threonine protein kinase